MKTYIKDIEKDEIRSGFLVTTDRKKIWQKEIELLLEIDRICKKYDIPYYIVYGTLIGAARHKGFVPWDDDIDIGMMRPDYMRFIKAASQEIQAPYFLQNTYTDNRIINWSKLMDDSTTAIEDWEGDFFHQGIFVDVFPLDSVADGTQRAFVVDEMCKELWICVIAPQQIADNLNKDAHTYVPKKNLNQIINMPLKERMNVYEEFCVNHFKDSSEVCFQMSYWCNRSKPLKKEWFYAVEYMDFETVKIPIPSGYDKILTELYGDWRTPHHESTPHDGMFMSADISYQEMLRKINQDLLKCGDYLW